MNVGSFFLTLQFILIVPSLTCDLAGYDIGPLSNASYWMLDVTPSYCFSTGDALCRVYFSICKQLPTNICGNGVSVCEKDSTSGNISVAYAASSYNYRQTGGSIVFSWTGANCSAAASVITIVLSCSAGAQWDPTAPNVTSYMTSFTRAPGNTCNVTISLLYSGACQATPTSTTHPTLLLKSTDYKKLALVVVVTVLCILVAVALFYLLVGIIFQIVIKKERGLRMIPNYDFWHECFTSFVICGICRRGRATTSNSKYNNLSEEMNNIP